MINASIMALHGANSSNYEECWICYSPQPPFYEGIALFGEMLATNDTNKLDGAQNHMRA